LILLQRHSEPRSLPPHSSIAPADARREAAERWLTDLFGDARFELAPASADASFRRYFRVTRGEASWILMDAPPDKEDVRPFITIAQLLTSAGVNVPVAQQQNLAEGYLLLTDLGTQTYFAALSAPGFAELGHAHADFLYSEALAALVRMQASTAAQLARLTLYSEAALRREMGLFEDWFLRRHLNVTLTSAERQGLEQTHDFLISAALEQPRVFVHRDYHSRNLMVSGGRHGPTPGILDFQDAVLGPITYDLVSLLRDCYVAWPAERVRDWLATYRKAALDAGLDVGPSEARFQRWFDLMGVQRHLKAIGIFARLMYRDGKPGYLNDIPRTANYVSVVSSVYPELAPLQRLLEARVLTELRAETN
jgi:aminoglycoside/choline kinase family phosphotransferase